MCQSSKSHERPGCGMCALKACAKSREGGDPSSGHEDAAGSVMRASLETALDRLPARSA